MSVKRSIQCLLLVYMALPALGQTQEAKDSAVEAETLPMPYEESITRSQALQNEGYWQQQVIQNSEDVRARFNLVLANRQLGNANFYLYNNAEVLGNVDTIMQLAPGSFEADFAGYLANYPTRQGFDALERAAAKAPSDPLLTGPLMEKALVEQNQQEAKTLANAMADRNLLDKGLIAVANDVSTSTKKQAILFCEGEMDCYPLFAQQAAEGKPDEKTLIIDRQLLQNLEYRKSVWQQSVGSGQCPSTPNAVVESICQKSKRPCYLTLSLDRTLIVNLQDKLFLTGNVFQYSATPLSNIPMLEANWKKMNGQDVPSSLNANYLLPAIALRNHYTQNKQAKKAAQMDEQVKRLATRNGMFRQLQSKGIID